MKRLVWFASGCLILGLLGSGPVVPSRVSAQGYGPLVLLTTIQVYTASNRFTATPDYMTLFSVLGETGRAYLPLVLRNRDPRP
jgi:hypothetical protein